MLPHSLDLKQEDQIKQWAKQRAKDKYELNEYAGARGGCDDGKLNKLHFLLQHLVVQVLFNSLRQQLEAAWASHTDLPPVRRFDLVSPEMLYWPWWLSLHCSLLVHKQKKESERGIPMWSWNNSEMEGGKKEEDWHGRRKGVKRRLAGRQI